MSSWSAGSAGEGKTRHLRKDAICVSKQDHHFVDKYFSPIGYQNIIGNDIGLLNGLMGRHFRKLNEITTLFIQENVFEIVVWHIVTILSRTQCVHNFAIIVMNSHETFSLSLALHISNLAVRRKSNDNVLVSPNNYSPWDANNVFQFNVSRLMRICLTVYGKQ